MSEGALTPLLSFALVIVLIPVGLWLLKRTPMGGAAQGKHMRTVAVLPLSASHRVVTVEVGAGLHRHHVFCPCGRGGRRLLQARCQCMIIQD